MQADDYMLVGNDTFWQWEDQGEVLTVAGGNTVIYTEQLMQVLEGLSEQGLPLLGSLVLVLVATHPERFAMLADIRKRWLSSPQSAAESAENDDTLALLERIANLPATYQTGKNRFLLLQTLFREAHNTLNPRRSKQVLQAMKTRDRLQFSTAPATGKRMLQQEIKVIRLLSRRFPDRESIIKAMTDVPALPELPEMVSIEEQVILPEPKDFFEQLLQRHQTTEVAALIKPLWAGLHIPYRQTSPSRHPVGGVADLTNKGDLSRLLVSEFANDDLLFLSRLANNEALYLNREIPPDSEQKTRIVLIDTSVKCWGTPKTIGFGVALAMSRHPKTNIPCSVYTIGNQHQAVSLDTVESVIEGLEQLSVCLSPEQGFTDVMALYEHDKSAEICLVTTPATLSLPAMQLLMSQVQHRLTYLFLADSHGRLDVYRQYPHGRKHMQQLQLPLDELWRKKAPATAAEPAPLPHLQTLIGQCPLLFPVNPAWRTMLTTGNDIAFCITPERLLLQHTIYRDVALKGWQLVLDELPYKSGQSEIGQLRNGEYVLLQFRHATRKLHRINLTTHMREEIDYPHWSGKKYPSFFFDPESEAFYHLTGRDCWKTTATGPLTAVCDNQSNRSALIDRYNRRTQQLQELLQIRWGPKSILQHIHAVYLTDRMTLVLNSHELQFASDHIRFIKAGQFTTRATAVLRAADQFVFPDGSSLTVNTAGMLVLVSSKREVRPVYLPSVLDDHLAIATTTAYAGDDYYLPEKSHLERCSVSVFRQKFIAPILQAIADHGNTA